MLEGIWNLVWQYSLSYTWANEITQSPLCGIVQTSQVDIVPEQMDVVTPPRPSLNLGEERGHSVSGRHPYPENNGTLGVQGTSTHREPTNRDGWFPGTQSQGSSLYHDTAYLGDPRPQTGEPGPDRTRHCFPELRDDSFHSNGPSNYTSDPGHNAEHTEHPAGMYSSSTASRLFHEGVPQYENTLGYYTPHPHNDNRYRTTGTRLAGQTSLEYPTSMSCNDYSYRTMGTRPTSCNDNIWQGTSVNTQLVMESFHEESPRVQVELTGVPGEIRSDSVPFTRVLETDGSNWERQRITNSHPNITQTENFPGVYDILADSQGQSDGDSSVQNRKEVRPEQYDGSTDWLDYIKYFETVAAYNQWTPADKAARLAITLTGAARQAWSDSGLTDLSSFRDLQRMLKQRFHPEGLDESFKDRFRHRVKSEDESFIEFGHSLRRLAVRAFPQMGRSARDSSDRPVYSKLRGGNAEACNLSSSQFFEPSYSPGH